MDAVEFVKEEIRMCASYQNCTTDCPLYDAVYCSVYPKERTQEEAVEIVSRVESWSDEHPRKTRQNLVLKQWPNAQVDNQGILFIHPCELDKTMRRKDGPCYKGCEECRAEFWGQEVN